MIAVEITCISNFEFVHIWHLMEKLQISEEKKNKRNKFKYTNYIIKLSKKSKRLQNNTNQKINIGLNVHDV